MEQKLPGSQPPTPVTLWFYPSVGVGAPSPSSSKPPTAFPTSFSPPKAPSLQEPLTNLLLALVVQSHTLMGKGSWMRRCQQRQGCICSLPADNSRAPGTSQVPSPLPEVVRSVWRDLLGFLQVPIQKPLSIICPLSMVSFCLFSILGELERKGEQAEIEKHRALPLSLVSGGERNSNSKTDQATWALCNRPGKTSTGRDPSALPGLEGTPETEHTSRKSLYTPSPAAPPSPCSTKHEPLAGCNSQSLPAPQTFPSPYSPTGEPQR